MTNPPKTADVAKVEQCDVDAAHAAALMRKWNPEAGLYTADLDALAWLFAGTRHQALSPARGEGETWASINQWCDETFGPATVSRIIARAKEEFDELIDATDSVEHAAIEAADVTIILCRIPGFAEALQKKMAINRARKWNTLGDGTGYHVKELASLSEQPRPSAPEEVAIPAGMKAGQRYDDLAEEVCSAANIVSYDGYYELDIDAVAQTLARQLSLKDARLVLLEPLLDDVPDNWRARGYRDEAQEIADMANVGRSLIDAIADAKYVGSPIEHWMPADGPAEIVTDLLNMLIDATPKAPEVSGDREAIARAVEYLRRLEEGGWGEGDLRDAAYCAEQVATLTRALAGDA